MSFIYVIYPLLNLFAETVVMYLRPETWWGDFIVHVC